MKPTPAQFERLLGAAPPRIFEEFSGDFDEVIKAGTHLFHASGEPFTVEQASDLRGGGYDGVLWTAEDSMIAQTYIPVSGSSVYTDSKRLWQHPDEHDAKGGALLHFQREVLGLKYDTSVAKYDHMGKVSSHRQPDNMIRHEPDPEHPDWYPQVNQAAMNEWVNKAMAKLGYTSDNEGYDGNKQWRIRYMTDPETGEYRYAPQDYRSKGRLFALKAKEPLKIFDLARGRDSDLTDIDYHKIDVFRKAEGAGYDGIRITDFAQVDPDGTGSENFGHQSVGIFPGSLGKFDLEVVEEVEHPRDLYDDRDEHQWRSKEWRAHTGEDF